MWPPRGLNSGPKIIRDRESGIDIFQAFRVTERFGSALEGWVRFAGQVCRSPINHLQWIFPADEGTWTARGKLIWLWSLDE